MACLLRTALSSPAPTEQPSTSRRSNRELYAMFMSALCMLFNISLFLCCALYILVLYATIMIAMCYRCIACCSYILLSCASLCFVYPYAVCYVNDCYVSVLELHCMLFFYIMPCCAHILLCVPLCCVLVCLLLQCEFLKLHYILFFYLSLAEQWYKLCL